MTKPSATQLGIDLDALDWTRSQTPEGGIEVAFAGEWTLLRTANEPGALVSVFDEREWACFLDGAKKGEFDRVAD
ncbi:DUF397 domain-containing protein [Actinomadura sp. CNU-125]|uniref:DUF397 domain-containing protein n=1 Tax=Actinomadura sp. CNU-125 TaxID=1904961 RepID=UPI00096A9506|nr:DUF397 domain-containing protein [Actinomadura sp. CNU-125]